MQKVEQSDNDYQDKESDAIWSSAIHHPCNMVSFKTKFNKKFALSTLEN